MQKQLYLLSLLTLCSYSTITHTAQSKIMLMSDSSNDKNKCYITAKHHNVLVGTLTAYIENGYCTYEIIIEKNYQNNGIGNKLLAALCMEIKTKNPEADFSTLKFCKKTT